MNYTGIFSTSAAIQFNCISLWVMKVVLITSWVLGSLLKLFSSYAVSHIHAYKACLWRRSILLYFKRSIKHEYKCLITVSKHRETMRLLVFLLTRVQGLWKCARVWYSFSNKYVLQEETKENVWLMQVQVFDPVNMNYFKMLEKTLFYPNWLIKPLTSRETFLFKFGLWLLPVCTFVYPPHLPASLIELQIFTQISATVWEQTNNTWSLKNVTIQQQHVMRKEK